MLFHLCRLAPLGALLQHVYLQLCLSLPFLSPLTLKLNQRWKPNISSGLSWEYIKPWACAWLSGNRGFFCICRSLSKHLFPYVAHSQTLPSQGVWFDTCTIPVPCPSWLQLSYLLLNTFHKCSPSPGKALRWSKDKAFGWPSGSNERISAHNHDSRKTVHTAPAGVSQLHWKHGPWVLMATALLGRERW